MRVVALVKPVPLGEPGVARGQLVVEGLPWGLAPGERRTMAAAKLAGEALGAEVAALALGPADAKAGLREALALGARRAVLVEADQRPDALLTARALAAAVRRLGEPGVVVAGSESADAQQGLLGPMVAELLGLDLLAAVERLEGARGALRLSRTMGASVEHFEARGPLMVTVSPRFHPAPHATSWAVGEAHHLPLEMWALRDVAPGALEPAAELASLARAEGGNREAERFEGEPDEAAAQLIRRLRAAGVVR